MRRLTILALWAVASAIIAVPAARADYGYGSVGPGYKPYWDCQRPWWGGFAGWGTVHGYSGYPAYRCAPTSKYRYRPCLSPPSSQYYGYPDYQGGYEKYPRKFVYDWSPEEGDQAPQPRQDLPRSEPYQAP